VDQQRPAVAAVAGDGVAARLPAWLPFALYGVLTAVGLVLQGLAGLPEDPSGPVGVAVMSAAILVWSFVGSLIAARRPSHPIGWLLNASREFVPHVRERLARWSGSGGDSQAAAAPPRKHLAGRSTSWRPARDRATRRSTKETPRWPKGPG